MLCVSSLSCSKHLLHTIGAFVSSMHINGCWWRQLLLLCQNTVAFTSPCPKATGSRCHVSQAHCLPSHNLLLLLLLLLLLFPATAHAH
jgi:hypothetical protein